MPIGTTTYTGINPEITGYLSGVLLKRALPLMPFEPWVNVMNTLPANETKKMSMRRFKLDYDTAIANMYASEGVVPQAQQLIQEEVSVTLKQIVGLVKITDVVDDTHTSPVFKEAFVALGEIAPRMIELDRWYTLRAGTNKWYANGAARSAVNTSVSNTLFKKVVRNLERNVASKITKVANTSSNFNSESLAAAYIAVGHLDLRSDIESLTGFTSIKDYPSNVKVFEGEVGSIAAGNIRFVLTDFFAPYPSAGGAAGAMITSNGVSADVYTLFIFGANAWESVSLKGKSAIQVYTVNPNQTNQSNPLGQFGYAGFKTMQGSLITNDAWCAVIECAATEL